MIKYLIFFQYHLSMSANLAILLKHDKINTFVDIVSQYNALRNCHVFDGVPIFQFQSKYLFFWQKSFPC